VIFVFSALLIVRLEIVLREKISAIILRHLSGHVSNSFDIQFDVQTVLPFRTIFTHHRF
jgi:hypothetical protein